jgi:hypothetical protein
MNRLHRFLTYVQLEDSGELSPPMLVFYVAFAISMIAILKGLSVPMSVLLAFGVGAVGQTLSEGTKVLADRQAALHAHEQAMATTAAEATVAVAKVSTDADAHAERVEKLAEQVSLLASPERVGALKAMADANKLTPRQVQQIDRL